MWHLGTVMPLAVGEWFDDLTGLLQQNSLILCRVDRPAEGWTCASKFEGKAITCLKSALEGWGKAEGGRAGDECCGNGTESKEA